MKILLVLFGLLFGADIDVLTDLYKQTNGDNWTNNDGWLKSSNLNDWYGISASGVNVLSIVLTVNNLVGTLPASLSTLTRLNDFEVGRNQLSGPLPDFSGKPSFQALDVHFNNLTGPFPDYIYGYTNLQVLDLGYNNFTGVISEDIKNLSKLQILGLANNSFTGVLPDGLGALKNSVRFWLGGNKFTGPIPTSFSGLSSLQILDLSRNQLTGDVPDIFQGLKTLKEILLFDNQLTGVLPNSISNLPNLSVLAIDNNKITGLPTSLFFTSNLFGLTVQNNNLTGVFPSSLQNSTVVYADFSGNPFDCPIPDWASWTNATCIGQQKFSFEPLILIQHEKRKTEKMTEKVDDGKVQLNYFGYSKCPYYVQLQDVIQQIPQDLYPLFDLNLSFFGVPSAPYPAGLWTMHGQSEGLADIVTLCAESISTGNDNRTQWLSYTSCVHDNYSYGDEPLHTRHCSDVVGYDWDEFSTCIRTVGKDLLIISNNFATTYNAQWSPTLYIDDEYQDEDVTVNILIQKICDGYTGPNPKPNRCNSL